LVSFWQSFREKVPYKSYVVDLAILPCDLDQADPLPVRIIEFNPFVRTPFPPIALQSLPRRSLPDIFLHAPCCVSCVVSCVAVCAHTGLLHRRYSRVAQAC
jgi:hypothetical protein